MPAYFVYVLLVIAFAAGAGLSFQLTNKFMALFSMIGFVVVIGALWEPLIKPYLKKVSK